MVAVRSKSAVPHLLISTLLFVALALNGSPRISILNSSTSLSSSAEELRTKFFALSSAEDVASLLEVSHERLVWHLWEKRQESRFTHFMVKKRRGGFRQISAPNGGLKILQTKMACVLEAVYQPGPSTHGFIRARSIITNAAEHVARRFVLNVDIENFFPSIHFGRFRGLLMSWPYERNPVVATTIAQVCFAGEEQLPQGAPSSPVVANMMCAGMDAAFARLAQKHRCTYTRYSDDLSFSTTKSRFPSEIAFRRDGTLEIGNEAAAVLHRSGFVAHPRKRRLQTKFDRQEVTGLVTNAFVNVRRRYIRQVRAMIHAAERYGLAAAEAEFWNTWDTKQRSSAMPHPSFIEVLAGKLAFIGSVRGRGDQLYTSLVFRARGLHTRFASVMTREDAVVVLERQATVAVEENLFSQGTGFLLDGVGLVTACHVVATASGQPLSGMEVCRPHAPLDRRAVTTALLHADLDIAVLRHGFAKLPRLKEGDSSRLRRGDKVTILGFPHWAPGHHLQLTEAMVIGRAQRFGVERIQLDTTIHSGTSGGPVLNSRGEVVGVAVTGSGDGQHPNAAIPISCIRALARQDGVALPVEHASDSPS